LYARVNKEILEQAEGVLKRLGIPMSHAIDMFLRQVVIQGDISFVMSKPAKERSGVGTDGISSADEAGEILYRLYGI